MWGHEWNDRRRVYDIKLLEWKTSEETEITQVNSKICTFRQEKKLNMDKTGNKIISVTVFYINSRRSACYATNKIFSKNFRFHR